MHMSSGPSPHARQQVADQLAALLHGLQAGIGEAFDIQRTARAQANHLQAGTQGLQEVVEVMGNACGEHAQRRYPP
jgi:hypothetical protein